jgi:ATPase family associated with various cellular activities (AAA)
VLTHPRPPEDLRSLRAVLKQGMPRSRSGPRTQALRLREAARLVASACRTTPQAAMLERLLYEHAVLLDDTPSERMRLVAAHWVSTGEKPAGLVTVVPSLDEVNQRNGHKEDGGSFAAIRRHVHAACLSALTEVALPSPFARWSTGEIDAALLALRISYCVFSSGAAGQQLGPTELKAEFLRCGQPLWNALRRARPRSKPVRPDPVALADDSWHQAAQAQVLLAIGSRRARAEPSPSEPAESGPSSTPTLVVCRSPIVRGSDRYDKEEIERHLALEKPLPLACMPTPGRLEITHQALLAEFPWAGAALEAIYGELIGRAALGARTLGMTPILLVGPAGSGKSRLARRIAEELGIPRLDVPLGGTSDTKVLGGTSRGWGNARPGDLATLMAQRRSASVVVLLDELDKAVDNHREGGGGLQAYLLALLEPETASRHTDVFLKTECDLSGVLWIATGNRLSSIPAPLLSRMRVLLLGQPGREHYPGIAESVLSELAQAWSLDRWALPEVADLDLPLDRLASARQVRVAVEAGVAGWARRLAKH